MVWKVVGLLVRPKNMTSGSNTLWLVQNAENTLITCMCVVPLSEDLPVRDERL